MLSLKTVLCEQNREFLKSVIMFMDVIKLKVFRCFRLQVVCANRSRANVGALRTQNQTSWFRAGHRGGNVRG